MIPYTVNKWGFGTNMLGFRGSVIPRALVWAIPTAVMAAGVWYYQNEKILPTVDQKVRQQAAGVTVNGYGAVLGFLLIFRTQKAYGRYWECAMYLQKARGEWFNACSNLVSFCSAKPEKVHEVKKFQQNIVRLISLLFNSAIGEVCSCPADYDVIDPLMDKDCMVFLQSKSERCEIVMQWIQRLVVDNIRASVIDIAPPIVSRVFQEFSLGIVNIAAAKKITIIPFPFPYAQMMQTLLLFQACIMPLVTGYAYHKWWVASGVTFCMVLLSWTLHFTAVELEMPFGDDSNDLPLADFVLSMNDSLTNLLIDKLQSVPIMHLAETKWGEPLCAEDRIVVGSPTSYSEKASAPLKTVLPPDPSGVAGTTAREPKEVAVAVAGHWNDLPRLQGMQPPPQHFEPPRPPTAASPRTEAVLGGEVASRLTMLSSQIEGHLTQIGKSLALCSRIEERVDKIGAEVSQICMAAMMFMERMDRLDKANMIGRANGEVEPSQLWFCAPRSGPPTQYNPRPMAPTASPRALPMSGASNYPHLSSEAR